MRKLKLRFHGTGNAWPVPLGEDHPFYNRFEYSQLSNAAYSIISENAGSLDFEVLIDAGHGTVQSLLSTTNRIPEAICLTHGHLDHTLSVDWVVQSFYRKNEKKQKFPVYTTRQVFNTLLSSYPHLKDMLEFHELNYGKKTSIKNTFLSVTAFPVYHGPHAAGATMLLFETKENKIILSGDLLTPLLPNKDYKRLETADILITDSNNRFPYPGSNHWGVSRYHNGDTSPYLEDFCKEIDVDSLCLPHYHSSRNNTDELYLEVFRSDFHVNNQCWSALDLIKKIKPARTCLVHYSGSEDEKYYNAERLSSMELKSWFASILKSQDIQTRPEVPIAGDVLNLT